MFNQPIVSAKKLKMIGGFCQDQVSSCFFSSFLLFNFLKQIVLNYF